MTEFIPLDIPIDPRHPDAINPALIYLAWVAWPHPNSEEQDNRDRLIATMAAAVLKQAGKQIPPRSTKSSISGRDYFASVNRDALERVQRKNVGPTLRRAILRIRERRLPAALIAMSWLAKKGHIASGGVVDLSLTALTADQQRSLPERLGTSAVRLRNRELGPDGPRLHDIGDDVWADARPALAMTLALPLMWGAMAFPGDAYNDLRALASLFRSASWVRDAIRHADALAHLLKDAMDAPPPSLLVPQWRLARTDARRIQNRNALRLLIEDACRLPAKSGVADTTEVLPARGCRGPTNSSKQS